MRGHMISPAIVKTLKTLLFNEQSATAFAILDGASVGDLPANLASFTPQHICLHRGELEPDTCETMLQGFVRLCIGTNRMVN
jgi:hypothetical protein